MTISGSVITSNVPSIKKRIKRSKKFRKKGDKSTASQSDPFPLVASLFTFAAVIVSA